MQAGKYDIGASSFTDTKAREKSVDFVTYLSVGESFLTKASGGPKINSLSQLCGMKVSVEAGTVVVVDGGGWQSHPILGQPGGTGLCVQVLPAGH